jgi:ABC-type glucose/galactose transport system permease subunit
MKKMKSKKLVSQQLRGVITIFGLLMVVFAGMCIYSESFRSVYNITNMLTQCVPLACVAMGQTIVRLRHKGKLYAGRGISTDIVGASIHAYLNALNKIVYEEAEA